LALVWLSLGFFLRSLSYAAISCRPGRADEGEAKSSQPLTCIRQRSKDLRWERRGLPSATGHDELEPKAYGKGLMASAEVQALLEEDKSRRTSPTHRILCAALQPDTRVTLRLDSNSDLIADVTPRIGGCLESLVCLHLAVMVLTSSRKAHVRIPLKRR